MLAIVILHVVNSQSMNDNHFTCYLIDDAAVNALTDCFVYCKGVKIQLDMYKTKHGVFVMI